MRILMLTPYLPYPPASGGQIRTLNLLKHLSKNHQITLICLYKNSKEKRFSHQLNPYCKKIYLCKRPEKPWQLKTVLKSLFSFLPFLIVRNYSEEAGNIVKSLLIKEKFDVIHAETFYIMPHIPKTKVPIFLVEQTIEYEVYNHFVNSLFLPLTIFFYPDILKLKHWEREYWKKAVMVGTVSEEDRNLIKKLEPEIDPVVIPNGAGDDMFSDDLKKKNFDNPKLLFMGNFFWLQNTEASDYLINKIFPIIIKKNPNIKLIIAGQNTKNKIHSNGANNVEIIDIAQDDVESVKKLYNSSTIFVAPVFGPGGTNLKILAAMASGLPVVSSVIGANRLKLKNNENVLTATTQEEFAKAIEKLLADKKLYEQIRKNAFNLVKEKYSWSSISETLAESYKKVIKIANRKI